MALQLTNTAREKLELIQQALAEVRDDLEGARELEARSPGAKVVGSAAADSVLLLSHVLSPTKRALQRVDEALQGRHRSARPVMLPPPRDLQTGCEVGKVYQFWDTDLYKKQGNHDVGDNSQCWAEAVVLVCPDEYTRWHRRKRKWEVTVTARFLHSGRVSRGMFFNNIVRVHNHLPEAPAAIL